MKLKRCVARIFNFTIPGPSQGAELVAQGAAAPNEVAVAVQGELARPHHERRRHASSRNFASAASTPADFRGVTR